METIKEYVLNNKEKYKDLIKDDSAKLRFLLKQEDVIFHPVIVVEFINKTKSLIAEDICKNIACNSESAMIELEDMNLLEFLEV